MSQPAIVFENVSKRYVLRHQRTGYMKDRLTGALRRLNPFARSLIAQRSPRRYWVAAATTPRAAAGS